MSEAKIGDGPRPDESERPQQLSHAPGSPRRQVQFGAVCCVQIGSASSIHVRVGRADWILSVAVPFTLNTTARSFTMDPTGRPEHFHVGLAPLVILVGAGAHAPEWDRNGHVVVQFGAGMSLACPPDPIRTAWQISGPHGQTWTCRPGGQVVREGRSVNGYTPAGGAHTAR